MKISALIHPLMGSIAALSVGVPVLDIDRVMLYIGSSSLNALDAKKKTKPRRTDLYDVFCAILSVLKGGIPWRMLPSDFPKWEFVYDYFQVWSKEEDGTSLLDRVLKKLIHMLRNNALKKDQPSLGIVDAKSIKNVDTAEKKGYDGGRKFFDAVKALCEAEVEVAKRSEQYNFNVLPKRWIVQRSVEWLEKCRQLWKNCGRKIHNSLQMTVLAFLSVCIRRF